MVNQPCLKVDPATAGANANQESAQVSVRELLPPDVCGRVPACTDEPAI